MSKRPQILIVAGFLLLAGTFFGTQQLVSRSRPQPDAEWNAEQSKRAAKKWLAEQRRDVLQAIALAHDPRQKRLYEYDLRILDLAEKTDDLVSLVKLTDGIDEFEALLIARMYFTSEFGACGSISLPMRTATGWVAEISSGREAKLEPSITIDAKTGSVRCAGHPTVLDPILLLVGAPNKALEPTPPSVTPRADARVAPAGVVAHL